MSIRRLFQRIVVLVLAVSVITSGGALAQRDQGPGVQPAADRPAGPIGPWQIVEVVSPEDTGDDKQPDRAGWPIERAPYAPNDQDLQSETEPNDTAAQATALAGSNLVIRGNIFPNNDVDYFAFTAAAGDRIYAATMTSLSPSNTDTVLDLVGPDGATVLETDDEDGTFSSNSSSIAGGVIATTGTYYLRVRAFTATTQVRPYHLYLRVQSGSPVAEVEPNNAVPQPLPVSGWVAGTITATTDMDFYSINLNAGDTAFISLDLDPERDAVEWNGATGLGPFNGLILVVNDAGVLTPDSEAFFMTVKNTGVYQVLVYDATGTTASGTYHLSVSIHPAAAQTCTTYTGLGGPLPPGGITDFALSIPGHPRIADLNASIVLTHTNLPDLDVVLMSPAGNENALFTDIGDSSQISMNVGLDDEAGIPISSFVVVAGMVAQPEKDYRLDWFDGEDAGGLWKLRFRIDSPGNRGMLQSWSLTVCEAPPPPSCPVGSLPVTVYTSGFEADDGGFTHSGTQDEWERGLPALTPITTCNSGGNCWKTDLDNTYDASSSQDLLSPNISLAGLTGPVIVTWAQKYQLETATFDHASVDVRQVGGANPRRLWQWLGPTQQTTVYSPTTTLNQSGGWGTHSADISSYAGQNVELLFHLDSDTTDQFGGLAVDDVTVTACQPIAAAITLNKTVGTDPAVCATTDNVTLPIGGGEVTYCYEVKNTGNIPLESQTLVDSELGTVLNNFPYTLNPGASAFITASATITQTTVNTATWTAFNPGPTNTAEATDTAIVVVPAAVPSISLDKTVGTDPAACAATDQITLPTGGGQVTYCYEVKNTGNVTFTLHNLVDSARGTILNDFPYELAPGASAFLTDSTTITQTTINTATWTAFNPGPTNTAVATDTATVNVPVSLPSISLNKTVGTDHAACAVTDNITLPASGGQVTYCYEVKNTGNITLTRHNLIDSELGTLLNDFPYSLAPGASAFLTESATITQTTINTATWTAFNAGPVDTASDLDTATVTVELYRLYLPLMRR
ncbi:MAG: proprotein convertase P-domain-containing protein [Thermoflexales bacterium]|nr:proprotein convertase P-domain-containing protein [Thermoflexales bacterium]